MSQQEMESPSSVIAAAIVVTGRVQGVAFRAFTERVANRLGLKGGVRNVQDGTVEVTVEGPRHAIDQFLEELRTGPPLARVEGLHIAWGVVSGRYSQFEIWYER